MDILEIATNSGLLVTLDGRIGLEEYRSVYGSLSALDRFANAILDYARGQPSPADVLHGCTSHPMAR
jgi:small nuclear ribonucleoprotein (snRNP)-like protein